MNLTKQQIRRGFWYHSPIRRWPPKSVTHPSEYGGGEKLNVVCTQLSCSQSEQRRIVNAWCETLPTLTGLKYLWFNSRVSQPMFEAACAVPNLEGLFVKWSGVKDISALTTTHRLKYLHLGSSAQVESISCVADLTGLLVLELENIKKITDLGPVGSLCQLQGLGVEGDMYRAQLVDTIEPLSNLHQLKYLFLSNLKSTDGTLLPLCGLRSLEHLRTALWWPERDYSLLRKELQNIKYGTLLDRTS